MTYKRKIAVLTSGGDAPGMNAAIRAVVRTGISFGMEVYGIKRGFEGLLEHDIQQMDSSSVSDIIHRGGTILRTARSKYFMTKNGLYDALQTLKKYDIADLVVIGGDGSFNGGLSLAGKGINLIGIPGTIDNDLAYTDYTIGFDTAVNTAISAIGNIRDTSSSHERATIIEVMGRNCGDIALWAGITSGAESILLPEAPVNIDLICNKITQGRKRGKLHNLIVKAEGVDFDSNELAKLLSTRTGMETRAVILGHIQRGGSPTAKDRMIASAMGYRAVELIYHSNKRNQAIGIMNGTIISKDLALALSETPTNKHNYIILANTLSI